jgi:hypothetical protein
VEVGVAGLLMLSGMASDDAGAVVVVERSITLLSVIGVEGLLFLLRQSMHFQVWCHLPSAMPGSRQRESEVNA